MRRRGFLLAAGLAGTSLAWSSPATALTGDIDPAALLARRLGDVLLGPDISAEPAAAAVLREILTAARRDFSACQYLPLAARLPVLIKLEASVLEWLTADRALHAARAPDDVRTLHCSAGYAAAHAGDRARANELLTEAEVTATRLADDRGQQQALTANIVSHRVSAAYLLGDAGTALAHAHSLPLAAIPTTERRARLLVDAAMSYAQR